MAPSSPNHCSHRGKSFETGIVPVARYSHPLSSVLFKNNTHWLSNQNTALSYVMYLLSSCVIYEHWLTPPIVLSMFLFFSVVIVFFLLFVWFISLMAANLSMFLYCLVVSTLALEVQLSRWEDLYSPIYQFNPAIFMCLFQNLTWISIVICYSLFFLFNIFRWYIVVRLLI